MFGYIYKTVNLVNGKIYVGQHVATVFNKRYKGSGTILKAAFKKYGKENFTCTLLEQAETKEALDVLEVEWISKLDARNPEVGYNIALGGKGSSGYKHTEEYKQLMRELNLGKTMSEESRQKMRDAHKRNPRNFTEDYRQKLRESRARVIANGTWAISENGLQYIREVCSRPKSEEHKKHLSEARINSGVAKGSNNPRAKKIYCVETNTVYSWAGEAAKALGISIHCIRQCRQGKRDNVNGYHFIDYDKSK